MSSGRTANPAEEAAVAGAGRDALDVKMYWEPSGRYRCPYCGKSMGGVGDFRRHLMIHTGEKPYGCPFCAYRAIQRSDVTRHCRTKHAQLNL